MTRDERAPAAGAGDRGLFAGPVAVLGPGGVGGFLAGALSRAGAQVTVVGREETASVIARDGIDVRSVVLGDFVARPRAVAHLDAPTEVLFVATKSTGLEAGLTRIGALPELVVPLLNGIDHMDVLRGRFGADRVAAATIRIESDRPAAGRVTQASPFLLVDMASGDPGLRAALERVRDTLLEPAGVPARVGDSEARTLWSKLVRLNAIACTTSAADRPMGFIRRDPEWRALLEGCVREAVAVAGAEGATFSFERVMAELDETHDTLTSSMQRDIAGGREPELDQIPGAVIRAGERHGIQCPTIAALVERIQRRVSQSGGA
jgi:2-dehydropantoate 2-reductase